MGTKLKLIIVGFLAGITILIGIGYLRTVSIPVLQPSGPIAEKELNLIKVAVLLSLIVVLPVFFMLIGFSWKYREGNKKAEYKPTFDHSRTLESIWWGIPLIIITILGIITWRSSSQLDPFKPIGQNEPQMKIQVIALQWKWLFIYPQQNVASVNFVQLPLNTPVDFEITSDAPMNSFWIPQLGGQIYAMSGMKTHLHLMATKPGIYNGSSANISGDGFAGMHFAAKAGSQQEFNNWISQTKATPSQLTSQSYTALALPSANQAISYYGSTQSGLYDQVVSKYLTPIYQSPTSEAL